MPSDSISKCINVAIAGLGNCAASLIEGLSFYRQNPDNNTGLLFPTLCGYSVRDIEVVAAFDISHAKVGLPVREAIYQSPNNFVRINGLRVDGDARVFRGPTLDGNPEHLARFVDESPLEAEDIVSILRERLSFWRRGAATSEAIRSRAPNRALAIRPRASASAMLPPPTKPSFFIGGARRRSRARRARWSSPPRWRFRSRPSCPSTAPLARARSRRQGDPAASRVA